MTSSTKTAPGASVEAPASGISAIFAPILGRTLALIVGLQCGLASHRDVGSFLRSDRTYQLVTLQLNVLERLWFLVTDIHATYFLYWRPTITNGARSTPSGAVN